MDYVYFWNLNSPFSNFYPAKIKYKDYTFISSEQFFMFSKAKFFGDEEIAQKVLTLNQESLAVSFLSEEITAEQIISDTSKADAWNKLMMKIKKMGRSVSNYDEEKWCEHRYKIMLAGNKLKFSQNLDLKQQLLATKEAQLVEASPFDKVWGIGLNEANAKKVHPDHWKGLNLLGKVLDEVKAHLLSHADTVVVNLYQIEKNALASSEYVYIGRANAKHHQAKSFFANPFVMKDQSDKERTRVVAEYKTWILDQLAKNIISIADLLALEGKKLVCYCAPKACHGDVIKELIAIYRKDKSAFEQMIHAHQ